MPPPGTCDPTPVDPRFSAVVTLEPSGQEIRFEEIARVSVPSLVIGGAVERQSPDLDEWRSFVARTHAAITGRVDLERAARTIEGVLSTLRNGQASRTDALVAALPEQVSDFVRRLQLRGQVGFCLVHVDA